MRNAHILSSFFVIGTTLLFACGDGAKESISGTVAGKTLVLVDSASQGGTDSIIILGDAPGSCSIGSGRTAPNSNVVSIELGGGPTVGDDLNGAYVIGATGGLTAQAQVTAYGAAVSNVACDMSTLATATAARVTITTPDSEAGARMVGTFDLTFGSDHVTGSFDAPACAIATSGTNNLPQLTCD